MNVCSFECSKYPTQIYWNFTAAIPKPNRGIYSALMAALASPNWRHRSNPDSENCSAESAAYNYQKIRRRVSCAGKYRRGVLTSRQIWQVNTEADIFFLTRDQRADIFFWSFEHSGQTSSCYVSKAMGDIFFMPRDQKADIFLLRS